MESSTQPSTACWEEGASCDDCEMVLKENETMVYTVTDSNTMAIAAIILSILGFSINLLTILSLLLNNGVRKHISTPHILSVLFTDLVFCSFILPILAIRFYTRQSEESIWPGLCTIFPIIFYVSLGAFVLSLMCVTVNRTAILFLQERSEEIITNEVKIISIFLCWFLPLLVMIPSIFGSYGKIGMNNYTQSCTVIEDDDGRSPETILYNIFIFLPSFVMVVCDIIIFVKLKQVSSLRSRETIIFILGIFSVFVFFLLTLIPAWVVDHLDECVQHPQARTVAYILVWTGPIFDPLVFLCMEKSYREAVKGLLCKKLVAAVQTDEALKQKHIKMRIKTYIAKQKSLSDSVDTI